MENLKKVLFIQLPNGDINLIPIEEIVDCKIIVPNEKLGIWVYKETIPGGASDGLGDNHVVRELTNEDIQMILCKRVECFVEVDFQNKLSLPSNMRGDQRVVLHLKFFSEYQKTFSIINEIIWNKYNKPFSKEDLNKALDEGGAIKRTSIGVTISDYVDLLKDEGILVHVKGGFYIKDMEYINKKLCSH